MKASNLPHGPAMLCTSSRKSFFKVLACAALLWFATAAGAQTVSTVYNFTGGSTSGANPWYVTLVQGTDGQLYGTTYDGGTKGKGTAFKVSTSGTLTLLHSFAGGSSDGANPTGGLNLGSDGNFYGTTQQGGSSSQGVIFKMTTTGTVTLLHTLASLVGRPTAPIPPAALISDPTAISTAPPSRAAAPARASFSK